MLAAPGSERRRIWRERLRRAVMDIDSEFVDHAAPVASQQHRIIAFSLAPLRNWAIFYLASGARYAIVRHATKAGKAGNGRLNVDELEKGLQGQSRRQPKDPARLAEWQGRRDIKQLAKSYTEEALDKIVSIMRDKTAPPSVQLAAAIHILDRGWGKPTVAVETPAASIYEQMTDDELRARLARVSAQLARALEETEDPENEVTGIRIPS